MQIQKVSWVFLGARFSRMQRPGIHGPRLLQPAENLKMQTGHEPVKNVKTQTVQ